MREIGGGRLNSGSWETKRRQGNILRVAAALEGEWKVWGRGKWESGERGIGGGSNSRRLEDVKGTRIFAPCGGQR